MKAIITALVTAMLRSTLPETMHDEARPRYETIAQDAVDIAFDPFEPPLFKGEAGRLKTASLLLAIASYESSFSEKVDNGEVRGDHGRSWCLMQLNLGTSRIVMRGDLYGYSGSEGWSGRDLVEDRRKCFMAALHVARESLKVCRDLSLYTSGRCSKTEPLAKHRYRRAEKFFEGLDVKNDHEVFLEL